MVCYTKYMLRVYVFAYELTCCHLMQMIYCKVSKCMVSVHLPNSLCHSFVLLFQESLQPCLQLSLLDSCAICILTGPNFAWRRRVNSTQPQTGCSLQYSAVQGLVNWTQYSKESTPRSSQSSQLCDLNEKTE